MAKILVIAPNFPQIAHSYINNEVEFLDKHCDVLVLSPRQPYASFYSHVNYNYFRNKQELISLTKDFDPDLIISWLVTNHFFARTIGELLKKPFIIKLHTSCYHLLNNGTHRFFLAQVLDTDLNTLQSMNALKPLLGVVEIRLQITV